MALAARLGGGLGARSAQMDALTRRGEEIFLVERVEGGLGWELIHEAALFWE